IAAFLGRLDRDRMIAASAPGIEYHDHRHVGFGAMRGIEECGKVMRTLFEAVDDVTNRVDDVVRLRPDAGLLRLTNFGTDRVSGGPYERPYLFLLVSGADGLLAHVEQFDIDHEDEALARFDELVTEPAAVRRVRRRVGRTAAARGPARCAAAPIAGDLAALAVLVAAEVKFADHQPGAVYGWDGMTRSLRSRGAAGDPTSRHEPLATLGD